MAGTDSNTERKTQSSRRIHSGPLPLDDRPAPVPKKQSERETYVYPSFFRLKNNVEPRDTRRLFDRSVSPRTETPTGTINRQGMPFSLYDRNEPRISPDASS